MMLRKADDFIIDRVFQPMADWLSAWITIRQLVIGSNMGGWGLLLALDSFRNHWPGVAICLFGSTITFIRLSVTGEPRDGMLPTARLKVYIRAIDGVIVLANLPLAFIDLDGAWQFMGFAGWLIGDYFDCCRRDPPRFQRTVPSGRAMEGA